MQIEPLGSARRQRQPRRRAEFRYYVDSRGCQHFNFKQRIWLDRAVPMAVTPVRTLALETLAVNLLARMGTEHGGDRTCAAATSSRVMRLARRFCEDCLLSACPEGWVIPRTTIEAWLASQRRHQSQARATSRNPQRRDSARRRNQSK